MIGDFAVVPRYQGAGSSMVNPKNEVETMSRLIDRYPVHCIGCAPGYRRTGEMDEVGACVLDIRLSGSITLEGSGGNLPYEGREFVFSALNRVPFQFAIFHYTNVESDLGLCGFLSFLIATACAQTVNFFVQKNFVIKSNAAFSKAVPKYIFLAVVLVIASAAHGRGKIMNPNPFMKSL